MQCEANHVNDSVIRGQVTMVFKGTNIIALCRDSILNILTVAVLPVVPFFYAMWVICNVINWYFQLCCYGWVSSENFYATVIASHSVTVIASVIRPLSSHQSLRHSHHISHSATVIASVILPQILHQSTSSHSLHQSFRHSHCISHSATVIASANILTVIIASVIPP